MNYVEISDLLSKGFTPEQIMVLVSSKPEDKPAPEDTPDDKPEEKTASEDTPDDKPEEKPAPDEKAHDSAVESLRNEIKTLRETLQKQNIINQHFDNPPDTADAEKALAGIIRPPFEEPDKK